MDTHARLQQLLRERGWTEYKLSKECGLAQSTIGNIFRRNSVTYSEEIPFPPLRPLRRYVILTPN